MAGRFHTEARFIDSSVVPWLLPPSPKNATLTPPLPLSLAASAVPQISGGAPPTNSFAPSLPLDQVREGRAAADDSVGAEHALGQVSDVHGAALAVAAAGLAAVDLGHHLADVHAPGDAVAVPAVGAGDGVPVVEVAADADGRRLLARVQVDEPGDLAGRELPMHPFPELAAGPHG